MGSSYMWVCIDVAHYEWSAHDEGISSASKDWDSLGERKQEARKTCVKKAKQNSYFWLTMF